MFFLSLMSVSAPHLMSTSSNWICMLVSRNKIFPEYSLKVVSHHLSSQVVEIIPRMSLVFNLYISTLRLIAISFSKSKHETLMFCDT